MTPLTEIKQSYGRYLQYEDAAQIERRNLKTLIKKARQERYTFKRIGEVLNMSPQAIYQILNKK